MEEALVLLSIALVDLIQLLDLTNEYSETHKTET